MTYSCRPLVEPVLSLHAVGCLETGSHYPVNVFSVAVSNVVTCELSMSLYCGAGVKVVFVVMVSW